MEIEFPCFRVHGGTFGDSGHVLRGDSNTTDAVYRSDRWRRSPRGESTRLTRSYRLLFDLGGTFTMLERLPSVFSTSNLIPVHLILVHRSIIQCACRITENRVHYVDYPTDFLD